MLMKIGCSTPFSFRVAIMLEITADLPTPELPVKKIGLSTSSKVSRMKVCFVVSWVGTMRSKYEASLSYWN